MVYYWLAKILIYSFSKFQVRHFSSFNHPRGILIKKSTWLFAKTPKIFTWLLAKEPKVSKLTCITSNKFKNFNLYKYIWMRTKRSLLIYVLLLNSLILNFLNKCYFRRYFNIILFETQDIPKMMETSFPMQEEMTCLLCTLLLLLNLFSSFVCHNNFSRRKYAALNKLPNRDLNMRLP